MWTFANKNQPSAVLVGLLRGVLLLLPAALLWSAQIPDLKQVAADRYGPLGRETVEQWEAMIHTHSNANPRQQVEAVNDFFNQNIRWMSDYEAYKDEDYWASPLETLGRGVGDCEDFSIAKYATLALMGIPPTSLRMVYVRAKYRGQDIAHMILAWYPTPQSAPLILDNLDRKLKPAGERTDLKAVFSFNADDLWLGARRQSTGQEPTARLSRWNRVVLRIREEGFTEGF